MLEDGSLDSFIEVSLLLINRGVPGAFLGRFGTDSDHETWPDSLSDSFIHVFIHPFWYDWISSEAKPSQYASSAHYSDDSREMVDCVIL